MQKKLIFIANTSWYLFNFRLNLILQLKNCLDYDIVVVAPFDSYSSRFANYGIQFIAIPMDNNGINPIKDGILIFKLTKLFIKIRPDCILSYTPKCNIYGSLAAGFLNIKIINNISGLGTVFIRVNLITKLVKWLYAISLKKSVKVFFQNKDDLAIFMANKLVNSELVELLPGSGVDTNHFFPIENTSPRKCFIFLVVARMLKDKGIIEFVEAARGLKKQYPYVECQLLGFLDVKNSTAISSEEMQTWVNEGIVNYLGVSDSVVDHLRQADCVVLPSYREGLPRSLLEAASVGKPIITTNAVGCKEVVDDGINGFLCEPRNAVDLQHKMEKMLLLSEAERLKMGSNSRKKALEQFDEKIVIERYVEVIKKAVTFL